MNIWKGIVVFSTVFLSACETPQFLTLMVYEDENRVVRLQTIPDANDGKGYSHPAYLKEEAVAKILKGLYVEIDNAPFSLPLIGGGSSQRQSAFSIEEVKFFAPLLVKGLKQATPEEVVTFYESGEISDLHELTTSGAVFVQGDEFHVLLANHGEKTQIWQDNEQYKAPFRTRPLEPINPQPGRLGFDPAHLSVQPKTGLWKALFKADPWQVGVRWKELK